MSDRGERSRETSLVQIPTPASRSRREFILTGVRSGSVLAAGSVFAILGRQPARAGMVWQIDPDLCTQCGKCATTCVLQPSAVKCVHTYAMCGYCKLCFGLLKDKRTGNTTSVENNRCPTDAIKRIFVEDPYYEMHIEENLCIGCGICVKGCTRFGNGSMYLQIRHDRCVNCNECSIARECPAGAISRVAVGAPYRFKTRHA